MSQLSQSWSTSTSLIGRIKGNDSAAWGRFAQIYTPLVYCWGRKDGLDPQDATDLVQEVFRIVFQSIQNYEPESFRGWLWTITQNQLRLQGRKPSLRISPVGGDAAQFQLEQVAEEQSAESHADSMTPKSRAFLVNRALSLIREDFSETTWNVFWKIAVDGRRAKDVAEEFGLSEVAARNAKFRVLSRLKEELRRL